MFRAAHHPRTRRHLISLTPLVDVVFILLIFFMLASSFNDWRSFNMALPVRGVAADIPQDPIILQLSGDGAMLIAGRVVEGLDLVSALSAQIVENPERKIIIGVEEGVTVQQTVTALDLVEQAGGAGATLVNSDLAQ